MEFCLYHRGRPLKVEAKQLGFSLYDSVDLLISCKGQALPEEEAKNVLEELMSDLSEEIANGPVPRLLRCLMSAPYAPVPPEVDTAHG